MSTPIYHLCPRPLWDAARIEGRLAPRDGEAFLHFSTRAQVMESADRHYAGAADVLLIAVDPGPLGAALRWEQSRGGALFPHLYAPLDPASVLWVSELRRGADDRFAWPADRPTPPTD